MGFTFSKEEKLKQKKIIDYLFSNGKSDKCFPVRMVYLPFSKENFSDFNYLPETTQVGVSVSKRQFKLAVDRNRIKRQMREAYRLNKHILTDNYAIFFLYIGKEKVDYNIIEKAITTLMKRV